ncbi:hypothetical protein HAX54_033464, partial [Datura stramonium]|nr:hypothetical protein [Datura stramonium]
MRMVTPLDSIIHRLHSLTFGSYFPPPFSSILEEGEYVHSDSTGKVLVNIVEEDVKMQEEYWSTALVGHVVGDKPHLKSIENYILHTWRGVEKPQILIH